MFGERKKKYRTKVNMVMGKKKDTQPKRPLFIYKKMVKFRNGVLIKFIDGIEYMITEK
jgi:hypothetical protein